MLAKEGGSKEKPLADFSGGGDCRFEAVREILEVIESASVETLLLLRLNRPMANAARKCYERNRKVVRWYWRWLGQTGYRGCVMKGEKQ